MVRETRLAIEELVQPLFIVPGSARKEMTPGLPGIIKLTPDMAAFHGEELLGKGIKNVLLFGVAEQKDPMGTEALCGENAVFRALKELKASIPELTVITDLCLCAYNASGHCGVDEGGVINHERTVDMLGKMAVIAASHGADMVAPSAMMDGMVAGIRSALDEAGFPMLPIMSYSAKFASTFYHPFRDTVNSAPRWGDRRGYQLDPGNAREALREIGCDVEEGADIVMVKPALPYLDVIAKAREAVQLPVAAYNVSGEYAMLKAAARQGWLEEREAVVEILTSIKRAGAQIIITYHAMEACEWLD
jgi:porphobilinogen synthase